MEKNTNVWSPLTHPLLGTWPTTQARAPTGSQTGITLVCRLALNPLSHISQGDTNYFISSVKTYLGWFTKGKSEDIGNDSSSQETMFSTFTKKIS